MKKTLSESSSVRGIRRGMGLLLAAVASLVFAGDALCALTWETRELTRKATAQDKEIIVKFPFVNTGDKTVKITGMRTNCGCTTLALIKKEYLPGEKGEVVVKFEIGPRMGVQRKPVVVSTDDTAEPQVALYLVADLPNVIELPKSFLIWREGETLGEKSLVVDAKSEFPVENLVAVSENKDLAITVDRASPSQFLVKITPKPDAKSGVTTVQLEAALPGGQKKLTSAYISVR